MGPTDAATPPGATPPPTTPPPSTAPPATPPAGATPPPGGRRARRAVPTLGLAAVMVLCGILFATTARTAGGDSLRDDSGDVASLLRDRETTIRTLEDSVATKRAEIDGLTASGADGPTADRLVELGDAAGLSAVRGPGVRITLTDAPTGALGARDGIEADDLVVHQQDLESFVNALWAGGAEAMMLQDQRVVSGSAVRCVGNTLLLEGRVYSPPFVITAIGPSDEMLAAVDEAPGVRAYRDWVAVVGLGETTETLAEVELPAFEGSLTLDSARPPVTG